MPTVIATITTPDCTCCSPCVTGTLSCRTRGGTATLCGYPVYTTEDYTRWRTRTLSGSRIVNTYSGAGCTGSTSLFFNETYTGACTYNRDTCAFTAGGRHFHNGEDFGASCNIGARDADGEFIVDTRLTRSTSCDFACHDDGSLHARCITETAQEVLSDEDTEADAIARLDAGGGGTWSSWSSGSPTTCLARYEQRTASISFVHQDAQWRITASGLTPGASYVVPVDFYRSVFGAGSYTLYQSITVMGTADGSGNLDIEGDVPNDAGYDTYAQQGTCPA